jgi:TonB-linked SusC/RagA family outer membrane protein
MKITKRLFFTILVFLMSTSLMIAQNTYNGLALSKKELKSGTNSIALEKALQKIQKAYNVHLLYRNKLVNGRHVNGVELSGNFEQDLNQLLNHFGLSFNQLTDNSYVIFPDGNKKQATSGIAGQNMVKGTVTDASTGNALAGVNILVQGTSNGTATAADGHYRIQVENLKDTLRFSYIGYQSKKVPMNGKTEVDVALKPKVYSGKELVVTALGVKNKEEKLSYSTQKIQAKDVQEVKGVHIGTSLTGKVAGLKVENSTEFNRSPSITLRGGTPLLVIDGVPYGNVSLRDISADDIKSMEVLKGATASALYGERGGSGAILITTKNGSGAKGLSVSVNSNTMAFAGYLALPKAQHAYSSGYGGNYNTNDYVWGAKLDHGIKAKQWDPVKKKYVTKELKARGKNNFRDFLQNSYVTNNNVSISRGWKHGSIRSSFNWIHKRGQYPNHKLNMFDYSLAGKMKLGDRLDFNGRFNYSRRAVPQMAGIGYNTQGYIYTILVWTGPEYNLSKYKNNYWLKKDEQQNWNRTSWYDNPYFSANEKIHGVMRNTWNAHLTANYKLFKGANLKLRSGLDFYFNNDMKRTPPNILSSRNWNGDTKGLYQMYKYNGHSLNNDLIMTVKRQFGDISFDGLAGGSIYYYEDQSLGSSTRNGLSIPGFYSLNNSVERPNVSTSDEKKQVNSLYAKAEVGYQSKVYVDFTGRNDWSSTLPKSTRSYFYPSAGLSFVMSNILDLPDWLSYWKLRGSFTISKNDLDVYETNQTYSTTTGVWNDLNSANYPNTIRGSDVKPETERTYEVGTSFNLLNDRLHVDLTHYSKYIYNVQTDAPISDASSFAYKLINTNQTYDRRGWEIAVGAVPIKSKNFNWNVDVNWSTTKKYYSDLDSVYSSDQYWVQPGKRVDAYTTNDWKRSPTGKIINQNGFPVKSDYPTKIGYLDPNWIWGLTNTFHYKNLSLKISLDGRTGALMFNSTAARMWETGSNPASVNKYRYDEVVNGKNTFVAPGVKVISGSVKRDKYGRITQDNRKFAPNDRKVSYETYVGNWWNGRQEIKDETFFKIRNISLKYTLPERFVKKLGAEKASIAVTGQNVLLWTKSLKYIDPDVDTDDINSPSVRYFGVNIGLTF